MTTFIKIPFAQSGDKVNPPDTDAAGGVNWTQGYPSAYSKDPSTDPSAKRIEREYMNGIFNGLSTAINEIQVSGITPFITATDNGGSAFVYGNGAVVCYNGKAYKSLKDSNSSLPTVTSDWAEVLGRDIIGNTPGKVPDMSFFPSGTSGNTWAKLPSGVIMQSFFVSVPGTDPAGYVFSLPTAFTTSWNAVLTPKDFVGDIATSPTYTAESNSAIRVFNWSGVGNDISILAIGF